MLTSVVVWIVRTCTRFATLTLLVGLFLAIAGGYYTANHFAINTDINTLISERMDWRQRDVQFDKAFDRDSTILAVVEAPTPELTTSAASALEAKLRDDKKNFVDAGVTGSSLSLTAEQAVRAAARNRPSAAGATARIRTAAP